MPAQPLPIVSSKLRSKAPLKDFENVDSSEKHLNEVSEIIRAAGEQISGYQPEPLHPIPGYDALDKLKAQDEVYKKSNYPMLKERLAQISRQKKQEKAAAKQQEAQQKVQVAQAKNASAPVEANSKGSLKDRMFSAMGIRRGRKTASAADRSQTREIAKAPSQ